MHSFEACSDAKDFVKLFASDLRANSLLVVRDMNLDRVVKATDHVFIADCCEYIEDIPDSTNQAFATAAAPIFIELIDSMVRQLKKLEPLPLKEGVEV